LSAAARGCRTPRCSRTAPCVPLPGRQRAAAEQVFLERGVEALADGVVVKVAPRHRFARFLACRQRCPKAKRDVLRALVGMMDERAVADLPDQPAVLERALRRDTALPGMATRTRDPRSRHISETGWLAFSDRMKRKHFTGSRSPSRRRPRLSHHLALLTQHPILATQPPQLLPLLARKALAPARIDFGLLTQTLSDSAATLRSRAISAIGRSLRRTAQRKRGTPRRSVEVRRRKHGVDRQLRITHR
jgi:hypothetical protein